MRLHRFVALAVGLAMALGAVGTAWAQEVDILDVLVNGKTAQSFLDTPVSADDLNTILLAGINAQSAMNSQPWHFSVITDDEMLSMLGGMGGGPRGGAGVSGSAGDAAAAPPAGEALAGQPSGAPRAGGAKAGMTDAAVAIVVSCGDSLKWNSFDAGAACDRMSVAALALGYGTKIVAGPCDAINASAEYKALCGISNDMSAIAVLLIGVVDASADAVTGATQRNAFEDVVTFVSLR